MVWKKLSERAAMATGNFAKIFGKLEVPPLSPVAARLLKLSREPDIEIARVAKLIASDPGIAAKILRTANSACFGLSHQVADIEHAVSLLGIKRITSLVLAFSTAHVLPEKTAGFDPVVFWQHSIQRAVFASALSSRIASGSEGEAFAGGLLQNIALPILLVQWEKYYLPIVESAEETRQDLVRIENELLTWNHAQAGAWMARNWEFPDLLVCCIGLHHCSIDELTEMNLAESPVAAVAVSSRLPDAEELCNRELQLSGKEYGQLCMDTDSACSELASLFNVTMPKPLAAIRQDPAT